MNREGLGKDHVLSDHTAPVHLDVYRYEIAENFELSAHSGRLISALARPQFVPGDDAPHMRDDDQVIGLVHMTDRKRHV